jgi:hypothetical protein
MSLLYNSNNAIINGNFAIWQRGTSFTSAPTSWSSFTADRWQASQYSAVLVMNLTQDTDIPSGTNFQYSLKMNVSTADNSLGTGEGGYITYSFEGYTMKPLVGKACILSFWIKSETTGTMSVCFRSYNSPTRAYNTTITINAINTWEFKTIPITFDFSVGDWGTFTNDNCMWIYFTYGIGTGWQTSENNVWRTGTEFASTSQTNFLATSSKAVWVTGMQLTLGTNLKPFQYRSYAEELKLCQRYYYQISTPHWNGVKVNGTTPSRIGCKHPVPMRNAPVVSYTGTVNVYDGNSATALSGAFVNYPNILYGEVDATSAVGLGAGAPAIIYTGQSGAIIVNDEL